MEKEGVIHLIYKIIENPDDKKYKYKAHYAIGRINGKVIESFIEGNHKSALIETICNKVNSFIMRDD